MQGFIHSQAYQSQPLGAYLVEAGLLTDAQVGVALADQKVTSMPFGEIVVARGWVKEQTVEFIMNRVVLPERSPSVSDSMQDCMTRRHRPRSGMAAAQTAASSSRDSVNWIG
ncbi:hypothetical protein [Acaryochloris sp. IP29b_bin.148]|uniref:hypothetical protein n=1 Tax=Acaryochloris sp. IP29b_bin.148 TaxID=2969218 RepID=UPI00261101BA|nr:hypothetical protein [Acaryochloris sp. IP29b_bin.148]